MERLNGLRRSDWVIAPACLALALLTLGAVGESGRRRAKEAVCQANLHQWGDTFGGIVQENDGKFLSGTDDRGHWWLIQLPEELQDWKRNRAWFCPMATTPLIDEKGRSSPILNTFNAWGIFSGLMSTTYFMNPNGVAGSYGLNGYIIPIPEIRGHSTKNTYEGGMSATEGWGDLGAVPDASAVPMFLDALRFDLWPRHTDAPALREEAAWSGINFMPRCCINRHDGAVNCLFVDGSVRKVGLKELWTLKWHRSFNTAGPWTKAGGVLPEDWPEWLRPFKEY